MKRLAISIVLAAALSAVAATPLLAHSGGHQGGCEEFGQINRVIGQDPAVFGFGWARNLGDLVSFFAVQDDGTPGVGDIVENIDHAACG
ncbi:MAG: hypothetical protein ACRDHD_00445 [Candidatus Limnocylindria bacterium]